MPILSVWYEDEYKITMGSQMGSIGVNDTTGRPYVELEYVPGMPVPGRGTHQIDFSGSSPVLVEPSLSDLDAVFLPEAKLRKQREAWGLINQFVAMLPTGLPRYDQNFQSAALAFDKSAMTTEQLGKYADVFNWISMVWSEYDSVKQQLASATTLADVAAIEIDLSGYEIDSGMVGEDPDVSIADIRPA